MTKTDVSDVLDAVRAVWHRTRPLVMERVEALEDIAAEALAGTLDEADRRAGERLAHALAGGLGTFRLPAGSDLAMEAEQLLATGAVRSSEGARRLADLVTAVRAMVEDDEILDEPATAMGERPRVLLLSDDAAAVGALVPELASRGYHVRTVARVDDPSNDLTRRPGDVVIADLDGQADRVRRFVRDMATAHPDVAIMVITGARGVTERVSAAQAGARAFVGKDARPAEVADAVGQLLERIRANEGRVLAVDDDPAMLEALGALLRSASLDFIGITDPSRLWDELEAGEPDLVILDLDMPAARGSDLCRALRTDPRWAATPVLFLTVAGDAATIEEVFAAGADDFVPKPIVGPELLTRIRNRLERLRLYRDRFDTDAVTGLATRAKAEKRLTRVIELARRSQHPVAVALVDLDRLKRVNDHHGHATGDEVLRHLGGVLKANVRSDDVVARWGGDEFLLGMYGMDREAGVDRLQHILALWRSTSVRAPDGTKLPLSFSAAVAEMPADGTDVASLYRSTDAALYQAKANGRARVLPAGWRPSERDVDVALVDDDLLLTELVRQALRNRGLTFRTIPDGQQAADLLTGPNPELVAKVVLLDVDLPGLDGLSLLRLLAREERLDDTHVVVLTARTGEADALEALRLGAFDHVGKPFSVPILLERIERALGQR